MRGHPHSRPLPSSSHPQQTEKQGRRRSAATARRRAIIPESKAATSRLLLPDVSGSRSLASSPPPPKHQAPSSPIAPHPTGVEPSSRAGGSPCRPATCGHGMAWREKEKESPETGGTLIGEDWQSVRQLTGCFRHNSCFLFPFKFSILVSPQPTAVVNQEVERHGKKKVPTCQGVYDVSPPRRPRSLFLCKLPSAIPVSCPRPQPPVRP